MCFSPHLFLVTSVYSDTSVCRLSHLLPHGRSIRTPDTTQPVIDVFTTNYAPPGNAYVVTVMASKPGGEAGWRCCREGNKAGGLVGTCLQTGHTLMPPHSI